MDGPRSSRQYCGPKSWTPSALRVSWMGGADPFFKVAMGEEAIEPNRAPRVPPMR
jgi:hypothetical protein